MMQSKATEGSTGNILWDRLKYRCENSFADYVKYMFKEFYKKEFVFADFHQEIIKTLEAVSRGELKRVIINIPPRYSKTELVVKMYVSWTLTTRPEAKFIHLSFSDSLVRDNSSATRSYITSDGYQRFWPLVLKEDSKSQKKWYTMQGGGMYAVASGADVTGFGAGSGGAIIIDDPLKPDDAASDLKRSTINNRYNSTFQSRVNDRTVPVILIMQRLHEDDMSGYLISGGSGDKWFHLKMPALDAQNNPLWEAKHNFEELQSLKKAAPYTFAGQYMQEPAPLEGGEWKRKWFKYVDKSAIPGDVIWELFVDGAYTKDTANDPTGLQISGKSRSDGKLYILTSIDKYLELPALAKFITSFLIANGVRVSITLVEPKASGLSLIQYLRDYAKINVGALQTAFVTYSKIERVRASSPYLEGGRVCLVKGHWNEDFIYQVTTFPNAKHDEHIDLTAYAIERNLISPFFVV